MPESKPPIRTSRCGVCYWALYDGDWCQNSACEMSGQSVKENRILLTNSEARILIEAKKKTLDARVEIKRLGSC